MLSDLKGLCCKVLNWSKVNGVLQHIHTLKGQYVVGTNEMQIFIPCDRDPNTRGDDFSYLQEVTRLFLVSVSVCCDSSDTMRSKALARQVSQHMLCEALV